MEDQRTYLRQRHVVEKLIILTEISIQVSLQEKRRQRVSMMGKEIESLIEAGQMREAWRKIQ